MAYKNNEHRLFGVIGIIFSVVLLSVLAIADFNYGGNPGPFIAVAGLACIPATIAHNKGRSWGAWWWMSFLLFIIALPAVLLMKSDRATMEARAVAGGEMKRCPYCAELIRSEAVGCRYCGSAQGNGLPPDTQIMPDYRSAVHVRYTNEPPPPEEWQLPPHGYYPRPPTR